MEKFSTTNIPLPFPMPCLLERPNKKHEKEFSFRKRKLSWKIFCIAKKNEEEDQENFSIRRILCKNFMQKEDKK